jgi:Uma2 family endonuclease
MTTVLPGSYLPRQPPGQDDLPYDDGEPMESQRHREQAAVLIETLNLAWAKRNDFYVSGNMFLYFSELQTRRNDFRGPDVFVVLGVERKERKSWVVWEEGGRAPNVVIELLSRSTEAADRGEKMRLYASVLRVPHYFLYEPEQRRLEGFGFAPGRLEYVPLEPDARGDLSCAALGLSLGNRPGAVGGLDGPFLRWIDAEGNALPTGAELAEAQAQRAETEKQRAEAQAERAAAAEERAQQLAAKLRAAGIDPNA